MTFHQLQPGTILNERYRIEEMIGHGGMGAVYRATALSIGSSVALKQSIVPFLDDATQAVMQRESRLLARLNHPNLPVVMEFFDTKDTGQFLVMQYVAGKDLSTLLDQQVDTYGRPFTWQQVQPWATDLLSVLDYLHGQGIIHRDIKPSNLKLARDGRVMLLDFGLAKGSDSTSIIHSYRGYTRHYAPIEQIQGQGTDARSDLYSFAATFYTLLSDTLPTDALSRVRGQSKQAPDPLPPLHTLNPDVPRAVSDVIMHALALEPEDRPQSAQAMLTQLQQATDSASQPTPRRPAIPTLPAPAPPAPTQGFPFLPVILSGTGALVFLVMLAVLFVTRDPSKPNNNEGLQSQNSGGSGISTAAPSNTTIRTITPAAVNIRTPTPLPASSTPEATPTPLPATADELGGGSQPATSQPAPIAPVVIPTAAPIATPDLSAPLAAQQTAQAQAAAPSRPADR
ncbi:protein kinase [bacterium]|nr:protein kinase [bacterium]